MTVNMKNCHTPKNRKMCDPIIVNPVMKMQPHLAADPNNLASYSIRKHPPSLRDKQLQPFSKDFPRFTFDFQGPPASNVISQIVQKCTFAVYSNKTFKA